MSELSELLGAAVVRADPELARRLGTDQASYLDLVVLTAQAHRETRDMLASAVTAARTAGHSWDAIGQALGMSRQAAQQRFGTGTAVEGGRRLAPVTAFTEMAALREAGEQGWHSVGFGAGYHLVRRSTHQWEHARALLHSARARRLEADGWHRIGTSWFPWTYYKRPLDTPAGPD
jgi:hypothetical protein